MFLTSSAFNDGANLRGISRGNYRTLLGNWFEIYPFTLSELSGAMKAKARCDRSWNGQKLPCPPFELSRTNRLKVLAEVDSSMKEAINNHNDSAEAFRSGLTFLAGSGREFTGGVCTEDTSLKGCLQRFVTETLPEEIFVAMMNLASDSDCRLCFVDGKVRGENIDCNNLWVEKHSGVVSYHRRTWIQDHSKEQPRCYPDASHIGRLDFFLRAEDVPLAASNLQGNVTSIISETSSINGMLEQLENLGHKALSYVEGLNTELLEFQRQALQWALERERVPGGIQSYWWAKLPSPPGAENQEIYFNPITVTFRKTKPKVVRGGFIASEMGLGKT